MDNGWAGLVVFLFGDPHRLEGGEGSKDRTTNPDRVFPFWWGDDLDFHGGWGESGDFFLHPISNTWVHGGTAGENVVGVEVFPDVDIALHDGVVGGLVNTGGFHTDEGWLEEGLWASEPLVTDGDDLTVGKLVGFLERSGGSSSSHFLFKVESDIAEFFFDVPDDFTLGSGDERVTPFGEDFHEVVGEIPTGEIESHDGVGKGITFIDWDVVGNTITRVEHNTGGPTRGVERKNSLDHDIHSWEVEGLEHDLGHLFPVGFGVQGSFSEEGWALFWGNPELVVVGVMPDFLHIIPVGDDTVFDWVFQSEDTSLGLSFVTDVRVFLTHTDHNTLMPWAADDGWEDSTGSVITGETALTETGTVVDNQVGGFTFVVRGHALILKV